jgi:hypothetical protein
MKSGTKCRTIVDALSDEIAAGCPVAPSQIGASPNALLLATFGAQMIRNRFTILDLAYEAGRLPAYAAWLVGKFGV